MKKISGVGVVTLGLLTLLSLSASADSVVIQDGYVLADNSLVPKGLRVEASSVGYGVALKWHAGPHLAIALGYNDGHYAWNKDLSVNDIKYEQDTSTLLRYINAEFYPWRENGNSLLQSAYIAVGAGYINQYHDLTQYNKNGNIQLNGQAYPTDDHLFVQVKHKHNLSPYLGLGFSPKLSAYWSLVTEVGVYYLDKPSVTLSANQHQFNIDTFDRDLKAEAMSIANKSQYSWLPFAKLGIQIDW